MQVEVYPVDDQGCMNRNPMVNLDPILPGYCYPYVDYHYNGVKRIVSSVSAYCDQDGTAYYTTYTDTTCTNRLEEAKGKPDTCLITWFPQNNTRAYNHIRIKCTHTYQFPFPYTPGPYMNVSALYYPSSSTCNRSSSLPPYEIPPHQHPRLPHERYCINVHENSFEITCRFNDAEMAIYKGTGCNFQQQITTVGRPVDLTRKVNNTTTCASGPGAEPKRQVSAQINCGTAPNNGQPKQYASNYTYFVTGVYYHHPTMTNTQCDDTYEKSVPTSFGPIQSSICQIFAGGKSSYMITCSNDGQGRINIYHGTTTCNNQDFFSFAQGTADGKTCISLSMSNGDRTYQDQAIKIRCSLNSSSSSSSLYLHTYTYMVLLCALVICINTFASI